MESAADRAENDIMARLFRLMPGIFFGGGLLASIEALLVPRLKLVMHMGYAEAMLAQLAYYSSYLLFALPATWLTARTGALRAIAVALCIISLGCCAFAVAQYSSRYAAMLAALLMISSGATILQIACNGLMATYGAKAAAVSRFTLLQAFNAVGTVAGPVIAAWFLLGQAGPTIPLVPFLALAAGFAILAICIVRDRNLLPHAHASAPTLTRMIALIRRPKIATGTAAIFAYVGAEVTVGILAVGYLTLPDSAAVMPVAAGRLVALYWAGAMVGRFAGAWALRHIAAQRLLARAAIVAALLIAAAILLHGYVGSGALLAVGICNSIMFPTIYGLAMPRDHQDVPAASMWLCIAVIGGAIVPMLAGIIADRTSPSMALILPALCYLVILMFALSADDRPEMQR
ncbi:MFS transporter [Sphingomonas nostoxanthinifaciens]|nr:MFS transporter [Sphingomonas nostoxanthinifaciens]